MSVSSRLGMMADDPSTTRRRYLSRVVESALFFFGVASSEQFEGLLDDAEQAAACNAAQLDAECVLPPPSGRGPIEWTRADAPHLSDVD